MAGTKDKPISMQQIVDQVSGDLAKRFDAAIAPSILKLIELEVKNLSKNLEKRISSIADKQFSNIKITLQQNENAPVTPEAPAVTTKLPTTNKEVAPDTAKPSADKRTPSLLSSLTQAMMKAIQQGNTVKQPREASALNIVDRQILNKPQTEDIKTNQTTAKKEPQTVYESMAKLFMSNPKINKQESAERKDTTTQPKVQQAEQKSLLAPEEESMKVVFDGFTDKGIIELKEKLPKILQDAFKDLLKGNEVKEKEKKGPSNLMEWLGSLIGPGVLKGAMAALAGISGLFISLHGMFTSDWYKGLAKLVGRGLMDFSGFTKMAEGFIGRFASTLINLPKRILSSFGTKLAGVFSKFKDIAGLIRTSSIGKQVEQFAGSFISRLIAIPKNLISGFGKSIMSMFGEGLGKSALGAGLNAAKGFIPRLLGGITGFLKKVPILGSIITIGYAWDRFNKGDVVGGGLEVLSGVANAFALTPLSWAIDGLNAFLDYKAGGIGPGKKGKGSIIGEWVKQLGSWVLKKTQDIPILGPLIRGTADFVKDPLGSLKSLALAIPGVYNVINFFQSPMENTKAALSGAANWVGKFKDWAIKKMETAPMFGPLIKSMRHFGNSEWMKGFKQLAYTVPYFEYIGGLFGDTEVTSTVGKTGQKVSGWAGKLKDWAVEKITNMPVIKYLMKAGSLLKNPLGLLRSLGSLIPSMDSVAGFFESPVEAIKDASTKASDWMGKVRDWISEKITNMPILGPMIKGVEMIFSGNVLDGLKEMMAAGSPVGALVNFLSETAVGQKVRSVVKSATDWIGDIGKSILKSIINFLPETFGIRASAAKMFGIDIASSGEQSSTIAAQPPQSSAASAPTPPEPAAPVPDSPSTSVAQPVKQAGDAVVDPKKGLIVSSPKEGAIVQLSKKDGIVAGPITDKDSKGKESYPKHLTSASNLEILRNKKMDEVAENTRKTYRGIEQLSQSITLLAKALEKTTGISPTVINNISKGNQAPAASVTMTQIAQQGNPDIRNVRSTFTKMAY